MRSPATASLASRSSRVLLRMPIRSPRARAGSVTLSKIEPFMLSPSWRRSSGTRASPERKASTIRNALNVRMPIVIEPEEGVTRPDRR